MGQCPKQQWQDEIELHFGGESPPHHAVGKYIEAHVEKGSGLEAANQFATGYYRK